MDCWDEGAVNSRCLAAGFRKLRGRNWMRTTTDFVQLVNLQGSSFRAEQNYLNVALWPLALGDPSSMAHYKWPFNARASVFGATDLDGILTTADRLRTLDDLATMIAAQPSLSKHLRPLIAGLLQARKQ